MGYDEACEAVVSRSEAAREIRNHSLEPADFFAECGERDTYRGSVVLDWLGY